MAEGTLVITISNQVTAPAVVAGVFITGWHVPTDAELVTLRTFIDPAGDSVTNVSGVALKEAGFSHWTDSGNPVNDGTDAVGFTAIGAGVRTGTFALLNRTNYLWTSESASPAAAYVGVIEYNARRFLAGNNTTLKLTGASIRLIKDDDDDPGTVLDYDGYLYNTVKIGNQVWMAANLRTTHWADGTPIPIVTDDAAWMALTTSAMCYYNNTP